MKNKIAVILYSSFIMLFLVLGVLTEGSGYSVSERRKLAEKPELSYENITSGNYMTEFEEYSTISVKSIPEDVRVSKGKSLSVENDKNIIFALIRKNN